MSASLAVYIFIVISIAFIVKGLVGFGDPLISSPLLVMRLNNKDISPSLLPISLILNTFIVYKNRKSFSFRAVAPIAVWVLLGIIPGTLLLKLGAPDFVKILLGLLIIGLGIEMLTRDSSKEMKANPVLQAIMSFFSGVTAGLFGINLLFLIYLERTSKGRNEFRANVCFVFLLENLFRVFVYLYNGIFTAFTLQISAISIPAAFLGMWIGGQIDKRISENRVRKLIVYVFILGGISTLIKAILTLI